MIDVEGSAHQHVRLLVDGKPFGAELTDNAYDPDGYRFHDVFHFAYAAVLGWSPITRALLRRKRKSQPPEAPSDRRSEPTSGSSSETSSLSDFGSSIEYGFVAGSFGIGLS